MRRSTLPAHQVPLLVWPAHRNRIVEPTANCTNPAISMTRIAPYILHTTFSNVSTHGSLFRIGRFKTQQQKVVPGSYTHMTLPTNREA